jgi:pimeloyl-ACP methyl ester carboxylesterase
MERRAFQTPLGEVWLWGEPEAFDGDKPVVLIIHGAFEDERTLWDNLPPHMPEAAILIGHLPGNHCPELKLVGVPAYAAAFSDVLAELARPAVICGISTGALVALRIRSPSLLAALAVEPPIHPALCWPLIPSLRRRAFDPGAPPWVRRFVEAVFGVYRDRIEARDYMPVPTAVPVTVVVGDEPLMPTRPFQKLPSLVSDEDRASLEALPGIRLLVAKNAGHAVPKTHDRLLVGVLREYVSGQLQNHPTRDSRANPIVEQPRPSEGCSVGVSGSGEDVGHRG